MRGGPEQTADQGRAIEELLEVVERRAAGAGRAGSSSSDLDDGPLGVLAEPDRLRDRRRDQAGVADRREFDEEGAARVFRPELFRDAQAQPRLAGAAGTRQRHQPRVPHQLADLADLPFAADEARDLRRQVGRRLERPGRREVVGQARPDELGQALGRSRSLSRNSPRSRSCRPAGSEPRTRAPVDRTRRGPGRRGQRRRCAPPDGRPGRRSCPRRGSPRPCGVPIRTRTAPTSARPRLGREGALRGSRGRHCRGRALEDDEEGVALGRDLDPAGRLEGGAKEGLVAFEKRPERRAQGGSRGASTPRCR